MSEPKFTPGPWEWTDPEDEWTRGLWAPGDDPVIIEDEGRLRVAPKDMALIAAAPDLYEALADIILLVGDIPYSAVEKAAAALKKARGEKP